MESLYRMHTTTMIDQVAALLLDTSTQNVDG